MLPRLLSDVSANQLRASAIARAALKRQTSCERRQSREQL